VIIVVFKKNFVRKVNRIRNTLL